MFDDSSKNIEYARYAAISAGGLLVVFAFLSMFGVNMLFGGGNFFAYIIMIFMGLFILGIEIDNNYMPSQIKFVLKSNKMRAYVYLVVGILNFSAIIPAIILISAAILYYTS